ncbi:hypothetical protein ABT173_10110 [Streptomyces sp. NPDC001795]|uniref:hypothetical protein n=1 Tax=Streptomyces sp. NPDC001795 TaxID=3154525 RepID=UPI00332A0972
MGKKTVRLATVVATAAIGAITGVGMASGANTVSSASEPVNVDLAKLKTDGGSVLSQAINRVTAEASSNGPLTAFNSFAPPL